VQRPGGQSVANSVNLVIRGRQIRIAALLETREAMEPSCAELAARYRTEEDLSRLEAANDAMSAEDEPLADFLQFAGYIAGAIGVVLSWYAAAGYVPVALEALRAGRHGGSAAATVEGGGTA
jgi:hypothetical protein